MISPHAAVAAYVETHRDRLIGLTRDLISIPSENRSPEGSEAACQKFIAELLRSAGYPLEMYAPDEVAGLAGHPLATPGRSYRDRPNITSTRAGQGAGRSLILSGHVDTVPRGTLPWTREPWTASIEGNRLFGRGANDMKAGIALNLFVFEAIAALDLPLSGNLIFESIVDEEFGGVNGTLAARLRGPAADAAVLTEPSSLRICAGQRGGRTAHLLFRAGGGVLEQRGGGVVEQLAHFLASLPTFRDRRRRSASKPHPLYASSNDPVPVTLTKITTGPWGTGEPITVPEEARVELYWQLMPGEQQAAVEAEFFYWLDEMTAAGGTLFAHRPEVSFPVRWLPGSAIAQDAPLCRELAATAAAVLGKRPEVVGIEGPCDLFLFHEFGIPAVLWGPAGGNTHGSDEYVEIESLVDAARVLLRFVLDWCGVAKEL